MALFWSKKQRKIGVSGATPAKAMAQEKPILDDQAAERLPFCIPFVSPVPIPDVAWNETPTRCIRVNAQWCSYILGALECLDQPDVWQGTDEQIFDARQQVREIMLAVMGAQECEEELLNYVKYIGDCNSEGLLVTQVIGGSEGTARIDISSCIPQVTDYVRSIAGCTGGSIEIESVVAGGEPETAYLNIAACLEGEFLTSDDLPPLPVPSLIGDNLWFDTDGNGIADVNVGNVRGEQGEAGAPAPVPGVFISGTDLYFDADGDDTYVNLGRVVGSDGEDGECLGCDAVPPPAQTNQPSNDGLRCSVAINEARYLRSLWDKAYSDTDGIIAGIRDGLITTATMIAYFFPGVAVVAAIASATATLFQGINDLESNEFDDDFEEKVRCDLYCVLKDQNKTIIDQDVIDAWEAAVRLGTNPYEAFAADLISLSPIAEFQWMAYASSAVDPAACLECDCDDEPPDLCDGLHVMNVNAAVATEQSSTFTLPVGCCYRITWAGTVRVGGTAGSPLMGDGNLQQASAGSSTWVSSGDILAWNAGTGTSWQRLPPGIPHNPAGYTWVIPSQGTPLRVRWSAANYTNNSGTMVVTIEGEEC